MENRAGFFRAEIMINGALETPLELTFRFKCLDTILPKFLPRHHSHFAAGTVLVLSGVAVLANVQHPFEADQVQPYDSMYLAPCRMHEYNKHDNGKHRECQARRKCVGFDLRTAEAVYPDANQYLAEAG